MINDLKNEIKSVNDLFFNEVHKVESIDKLQFLKDHFLNKPLILFYEDFKENPHNVFQQIADYTGTTYDKNEVSLKAKHKSYSDKQLLFIRKFVRRFKIGSENYSGNRSWIRYRTKWFLLHIFLYLAKIIPLNYKEELIKKESLTKYKMHYQKDWEQSKVFAVENSDI